jgi:hypothetical protein
MNKRIGTCAAGVLALLGVLGSEARATLGGFDCGSGNRKVSYYAWLSGLRVVGLTDGGRLVCFNERWPDKAKKLGVVTGFQGADTALVGIDFRVQDGLLYGVGNAGGVYTIDTQTAVLTFVNQLTVPLAGTSFGVDFNPAADRLRIISDTGQNLRHNVSIGGTTIADTTLSYTPPTAATGVVGAGYTNNDLDATTATTLFDVDSALDQVSVQSPANSGMLAATGKLGVDTQQHVGFDVYSDLRNGITTNNRGFASLTVNSTSAFYSVNVLTGRAKFLGIFDDDMVDIAVPLDQ